MPCSTLKLQKLQVTGSSPLATWPHLLFFFFPWDLSVKQILIYAVWSY